ncbi:hypothetical protein [Glycomyces xiaoerkulensis]|uniref:hypothetical protein n=1 Tax=Glycomyces xiaoerkulensis TaxID=2038139 RepID=UPI000C268FDC|nr:hypothetical protein [Glycomyces xiaoerkulensis]
MSAPTHARIDSLRVQIVVDASRSKSKVGPAVYSALGTSRTSARVAVLVPDERRAERLRRRFADEPRITCADEAPDTAAPYRLCMPPDLVLRVGALDRMVREIERDQLGIIFLACVKNSDMHFARLERREAVEAAARAHPGDSRFDAVDRRDGTRWIDGSAWAFDWTDELPESPDVTGLHRELALLRAALGERDAKLAETREQARHWRSLATEPLRRRLRRGMKRRLVRILRGGSR